MSTPKKVKPTETPRPTQALSLTPYGTLSADGPWLLFEDRLSNVLWATQCCGGGTYVPQLFLVNPDGSGLTLVDESYPPIVSDELASLADPSNRLVFFDPAAFLLRPGQKIAYVVNTVPDLNGAAPEILLEEAQFASWHATFIRPDRQSGYLASLLSNLSGSSGLPELAIYDLPSGEIRDHYPLVICPQDIPDCRNDIPADNYTISTQQFAWSPDGRYLAYAVIKVIGSSGQYSTSTDMYVYDPMKRTTRDVGSAENNINRIQWSPDGRWFFFESIFLPADAGSHYMFSHAFWSATPGGSQVRKLFMSQGPGNYTKLEWLDKQRFLVHLFNYWDILYPYDFHLVDMSAGKATLLYGGFVQDLSFDPTTGTVAVGAITENEDIVWEWSTAPYTTFKPMANQFGYYGWDSDLRAIVYFFSSVDEDRCSAGQAAVWTPDVIHCRTRPAKPTSKPTPPAIVTASPDGHWQVRAGDGIWLEDSSGKQVGEVSGAKDGQVIWRPDSQGFFLVADKTLYYVSVPDMVIILVDQLRWPVIPYMWLGWSGR